MAMEIQPRNYLALLESGRFSDFVIECQGIEFKVHRAIVCSQSTMLDKAATGNFKEAEAARINLTEENPLILSRVLVFMYTNDYDCMQIPKFLQNAIDSSTCLPMDLCHALPENVYELMVHTLVFKFADMLGIESLKDRASRRFLAQAALLCSETTFAKSLRVMYESTRSDDKYLRLPVTTLCVSKHRSLISCVETVDVIMEHEPMAWNVGVELLRDTMGPNMGPRGLF